MRTYTSDIGVRCFAIFLFLAFTNHAMAQDAGDPGQIRSPQKEYSPYLNHNYPDQVYWGDTHLHTSYSTDAGLFGNRIGPDEAYRFAKGEIVTSSTGVRARLQRPLDWLVVADHAENLGLAPMIEESNSELLATEWGRKIHALVQEGKLGDAYAMWGAGIASRKDPLANKEEMVRSMWERVTRAAEEHNNPGSFTALIGFEWTATPGGNNLHRNIIFRDGKALADRIRPISTYDTEDPEELWDWMQAYEDKTGGRMFAIAHNGNLSNGLMFDDVTFTTKKPISSDYAERRSQWEPLYEVTQMKGDSEAHPLLSPDDEFADFSTWDKGSFGQAKEDGMIEKEYAREALKRGLQYQVDLGANPFKFGLVGSTDAHTSLSTTTEDNFFGKISLLEPSASPVRFEEQITGYLPDPQGRDYAIYAASTSASGLAGVWARENTRTAIWDAMKRKEVYASTGTRLRVRVFAGWDFTEQEVDRSDFAKSGYERGVPMGGELQKAPRGKAPVLMIRSLRDPDGANLDRIQVVKGWRDMKGNTHEKVYDVACSDDRSMRKNSCSKAVGNTVNVKEANYSNSIGDPLLLAYWKDPDFDPSLHAFYYVRVLEIPTPRWTTYDAKFFGVDLPDDQPASIQERAYTSPIWYAP